MTAEEFGEFERIARFFAPLAGPGGLGLLDDAALVECRAGRQLVVTADAIVAGVHYLPDDPPELVARTLVQARKTLGTARDKGRGRAPELNRSRFPIPA